MEGSAQASLLRNTYSIPNPVPAAKSVLDTMNNRVRCGTRSESVPVHPFVQCMRCGLTERKELDDECFCGACKQPQNNDQETSQYYAFTSSNMMSGKRAHPRDEEAHPWVIQSRTGKTVDWELVKQLPFLKGRLMVRSITSGAMYHPGDMLHAVARGTALEHRRKRKKTSDCSLPNAAAKQKEEWPDFDLSTKNQKLVDTRWGMHLYPNYLDTRSMTEVAGSDRTFSNREIPDKVVARCFNQRIIYRITDSGTSANAIANADASTFGTTLYGIGSYGGFGGKLNYLSTLPDASSDGGSGHDPDIEEYLLALPYMTKSTVDTEDAREFENDCIRMFQVKLAGLQLKQIPCTAVFFEIVLSGNGMRLSRRFCRRFQAICVASGIAMVIDECMTAGRCSFSDNSCLLSDTYELKPLFVTVGKMFGAGKVFALCCSCSHCPVTQDTF